MSFLANLKGFRTLLVNAVVALAGVLVALGVIPVELTPDAETLNTQFEAILGGLTAAVAVVNMVLRLFTTTPLGRK